MKYSVGDIIYKADKRPLGKVIKVDLSGAYFQLDIGGGATVWYTEEEIFDLSTNVFSTPAAAATPEYYEVGDEVEACIGNNQTIVGLIEKITKGTASTTIKIKQHNGLKALVYAEDILGVLTRANPAPQATPSTYGSANSGMYQLIADIIKKGGPTAPSWTNFIDPESLTAEVPLPKPTQYKPPCLHVWANYKGLMESYLYCTVCDEKKKDNA